VFLKKSGSQGLLSLGLGSFGRIVRETRSMKSFAAVDFIGMDEGNPQSAIRDPQSGSGRIHRCIPVV
jgi:hypothetical protein